MAFQIQKWLHQGINLIIKRDILKQPYINDISVPVFYVREDLSIDVFISGPYYFTVNNDDSVIADRLVGTAYQFNSKDLDINKIRSFLKRWQDHKDKLEEDKKNWNQGFVLTDGVRKTKKTIAVVDKLSRHISQYGKSDQQFHLSAPDATTTAGEDTFARLVQRAMFCWFCAFIWQGL